MWEEWQTWTPCEFYGHRFVEGRCTDCEVRNDEDDREES